MMQAFLHVFYFEPSCAESRAAVNFLFFSPYYDGKILRVTSFVVIILQSSNFKYL